MVGFHVWGRDGTTFGFGRITLSLKKVKEWAELLSGAGGNVDQAQRNQWSPGGMLHVKLACAHRTRRMLP